MKMAIFPANLSSSYASTRFQRALLCALLFAVTAITTLCVDASLEWIGRPFNGFLLGSNRIVAPIDLPGWSGRAAAIPYWSQLIAIDGRAVESVDDAFAAAATAGPGAMLRYRFRDGAGTSERSIAVMRFTVGDWVGLFANYLGNGLALLAIGFFVAFLRPAAPAARALLLFSLTWGLSLIIGLADFASFRFREILAIAEGFLPASLLYLTLSFPTEHPWLRRRAALIALFASSAVLALLNVVLYHVAPLAWAAGYRGALVWVLVALAVAVTAFRRQYRDAASPLAREKIRIVLLGIVVAFLLPFAAVVIAAAIGAELPLNTVTAAWWVFPASLAYAIVQRDLFEIDLFLRRFATYSALSAAVFLFYAAILALFSHGFHNLALASSPWFALLFSLAVLAIIRPLRDRLQSAVDRFFFRSRFHYADSAEALSTALNQTLSAGAVAEHVATAVGAALAPVSCRLYHHDAGTWRAIGDGSTAALDAATRDWLAAGRVLDAAELPPGTAAPLASLALLLPMRFADRLEGLLAVGPKRCGAPYGPRDLELLRTVANQAAMALRNAAAHAHAAELLASLETRVAARTRELQATQAQLVHAEKMACLGTLVAGVAHEINNPLSFIRSSIDLISSSLEEMHELLDRQRAAARRGDPAALHRLRLALDDERFTALQENAAICRDGAERATRIVRDLRTFSRPAAAGREAADLHENIERSLRLLQGEYKGRVEIQREYGALPRVHCDPGQIGQVLLNILANSLQAIEGRGRVTIRTSRDDGHVTVQIEDSGPGIPDDILGKIFDPFFTTKSVGKGTGLGLSIARSLVHAHGGDVRAANRDGRGCVFTVTLPIDGAAA